MTKIKRTLSDNEAEFVKSFQQHLSTMMEFDDHNHLVATIPRYLRYTSTNNNFTCNANLNYFNIKCNRPEMEHVCNYFNLDFNSIIRIIDTVANIFDEHKLFNYQSFDKSFQTFPNYNSMDIPVELTDLNKHDIPVNIRQTEIEYLQKIFFNAGFYYKEIPTLLINIDFIIHFKYLIRLEITKTLNHDVIFRVSSISTTSSVGRSRKNYKIVSEQQLYKHMRRYAFRRLKTSVAKLLKINKEALLKDSELFDRYIALAEMTLI